MIPGNRHLERWSGVLDAFQEEQLRVANYLRSGRITRATGMVLEAVGLRLPLGGACRIELAAPPHLRAQPVYAEAEVVGFAGDILYLMPLEDVHGLQAGARVFADDCLDGTAGARYFPLGMSRLGRVLDSSGQPLDGRGPLLGAHHASLHTQPLNPLKRAPIDRQIDVGIRAQFHRELFLVAAARERHCAETHGVGVLHTQMTQAAHAQHGDQVACACARLAQAVVRGDACAQQRGGFDR